MVCPPTDATPINTRSANRLQRPDHFRPWRRAAVWPAATLHPTSPGDPDRPRASDAAVGCYERGDRRRRQLPQNDLDSDRVLARRRGDSDRRRGRIPIPDRRQRSIQVMILPFRDHLRLGFGQTIETVDKRVHLQFLTRNPGFQLGQLGLKGDDLLY